MAGDWIKIRTDLVTSPKVVRMASALKADRFRIAGGLLSVWSLFDAHSADGQLEGYTPELIDELAAWPGFSDAMIDVGWLEKSDSGLSVPRFDAHNGASAKRRAMDADRKREVRKMSASDADEKRTREEKRREDIKKPLSSGDDEHGSAKITYGLIQQAYNEICPPTFPACAVMNEKRKRQVKAMCAIEFMGSKPFTAGIEVWRQYFTDCLSNPHWCGQNDRGWTADFDFVTKPANAIKLMERMN